MTEITILGIFEDIAQSDFLEGLLTARGSQLKWSLQITACRTAGCNFHNLEQHLVERATLASGIVIGVDGKKQPVQDKIRAMCDRITPVLREEGVQEIPILWSVARPSIEAWMMADPDSLPSVLNEVYGRTRRATRPGHPRSERRAKIVLAEWVENLLGERLLRGGREHAREVGHRLRPEALASSRTPELIDLLDSLPSFFDRCTGRPVTRP